MEELFKDIESVVREKLSYLPRWKDVAVRVELYRDSWSVLQIEVSITPNDDNWNNALKSHGTALEQAIDGVIAQI